MERIKKTWLLLLMIFGLGIAIASQGIVNSEEGIVEVQAEKISFVEELRTQAINQLIEYKFDRWETMPFDPGSDNMHITGSMTYPNYPDYLVKNNIELKDDLDVLLDKKMKELSITYSLSYKLPDPAKDGAGFYVSAFSLDEDDIKGLQKVYLFKNEQDIRNLGYVVSSYRTRINTDSDWRKDNIMISFWNIGNVRVVNPGQVISFMDGIHYDAKAKDHKLDLAYGRANIGGMVKIKGGGICGATWGINTVILPNKAFEILERKNHSYNFTNLYKNKINGQESWIPGLDIAVYNLPGAKKDYRFKNIRDYPVILVLNYDGTPGGLEELFVLGKEQDRGSLNFLGRKGNCFSWDANGNVFKSCYRMVTGKGAYRPLQ